VTRKGAPPDTLAKLQERNEQRHREALARGSKWAKQTERRRQQAAARSSDPASGGVPNPPPASPPEAPPPTDPTPAAPPTGGERPSALRQLLNEGLTGVVKRRIGRDSRS
jgi:hypothetical protein